MADKFQYVDGLKFTRDEKTGYYLNSTIKKRMHRYVWEKCFGEIPDGFVVHYIDEDKSNNDINNLTLMSTEKHSKLHAIERHSKINDYSNLDKIRPLTKKWHSSKEGYKWHKKHYEKTKELLHEKKQFKCDNCGKRFVAVDNGHTRFCSNACKSSYRRKSGVDDIVKECIICGKEFISNKYHKTETCSKSCASKLAYQNRKDKKN